MNQIRTAAELDALPVGSVVRSSAGTIGCRFDRKRGVVFGSDYPFPWESLQLPLTVLFRPDAPARTEPTEEQVREVFDAWVKCNGNPDDDGGYSGDWLAFKAGVNAALRIAGVDHV